MKLCPKCQKTKEDNEFYASLIYCKSCRSDYIKQRRKDNLFTMRAYSKKWYDNNIDYFQKKGKKWYQKNKERALNRTALWRKNNKEKIKLQKQIYYQANKGKPSFEDARIKATQAHKKTSKFKQTRSKYLKEKRKNDPNFKLRISISNRIRMALKRQSKSASTQKLLGCSFIELKSHLESLFQTGMTWDNYGEWHIDHKKPCASFDLTKPQNQLECFHYSNLQPLWAIDNLRKSDNQ